MQADLLKTLIQATELPEELIKRELLSLLDQANLDSNHIDMNKLRKVLVNYLQDTLPQAKEALK